MINWQQFVDEWEADSREILSSVPIEQLSSGERSVLASGLRIASSRLDSSQTTLLLEALGLAPEADFLGFLSDVGSLHLLSLGADDGVFLPSTNLSALHDAQPSLFDAWMSSAGSISMSDYLALEPAVDQVLVFPSAVVRSAIALSTRAGG
jgi:hypothetical protein